MTGCEIVPAAAKAAVSLTRKATDDSDDKAALQQLAAESPHMKAAADSYARRVAVKQAVLLRIYQPLARFLGVSRAYFDTEFHEDMAKKVADIPEEHLTTPSPSVAIPTMQGLSYSVEEPNLKEMYLNLLATATDDRVADVAHPSFAQVIMQLSPREAPLLLEVLTAALLPIVRLGRLATDGWGQTTVMSHLLPSYDDASGEPSEEPLLPAWVDNWVRLGIIEVDYNRNLVGAERYDWVKSLPEFQRLAAVDDRGVESLQVDPGIIRTTDFGARFLDAVSYGGVTLSGAPGVANATGDE